MSQIRSYYQGDTVRVGITIDQLGTQVNPTNGVKVTIVDSAGADMVTAQAATQGQYDEDNSTTTGQYYFDYELASDEVAGLARVEFNIDPAGALEGNKVFEQMFKVIAT